jgi:hypothetical protein
MSIATISLVPMFGAGRRSRVHTPMKAPHQPDRDHTNLAPSTPSRTSRAARPCGVVAAPARGSLLDQPSCMTHERVHTEILVCVLRMSLSSFSSRIIEGHFFWNVLAPLVPSECEKYVKTLIESFDSGIENKILINNTTSYRIKGQLELTETISSRLIFFISRNVVVLTLRVSLFCFALV